MATVSARILASMLPGWRETAGNAAYVALADRIRLLIIDGRLPLATRLPAERELASHLGISRTTVTASYGELRDTGYLDSVRGSGSVTRLPHRAAVAPDNWQAGYLDFSKAALPAIPAVADAARAAAAELPAYLGESGFDPIGTMALRVALADRYTARGVPTEPEQIMVTIGAQHAIALLARTILGRGDAALVENPSYPHAYEALRLAGGRLVPVSVTSAAGWDEPALEQAIQRTSPSMAYLMPDFHNPTGASMSVALREKLVALAERHGTTIVADETMAELTIDPVERPLPLAAYGPAVMIGSVGKTVWGGLRVGWIRAERQLIQRLAHARMAGDLGTPIFDQLVVKNLLEDFDQILDQRREQLHAGRDYLESALRRTFPEWTVPHVHGGLTLWAGLGSPVSSQLTLAARNEGLLLAAGPRFGLDGAFERFLRIPFGFSAEQTDRAVVALQAAWASVARGPLLEHGLLADVI
jgi:DNA-binding transcriptional MocR family regulator